MCDFATTAPTIANYDLLITLSRKTSLEYSASTMQNPSFPSVLYAKTQLIQRCPVYY